MNMGIGMWVVDDDDDYRYLISRILGSEMGIECAHGFCSAPAMLAALKNQPAPEVILMDVQMPGMSGIEAIPFVHQLAPNTQVVIITSCSDAAKRQQALANGAANFLSKDCSPDKVVEAIHSAMSLPTPPTVRNVTGNGIERRL